MQRRQSGLKSGDRGSGSTKCRFSRANLSKISIFSGNFTKKSDFPGKFLKIFDFLRQIVEKLRFFQTI